MSDKQCFICLQTSYPNGGEAPSVSIRMYNRPNISDVYVVGGWSYEVQKVHVNVPKDGLVYDDKYTCFCRTWKVNK